MTIMTKVHILDCTRCCGMWHVGGVQHFTLCTGTSSLCPTMVFLGFVVAILCAFCISFGTLN